MGGIFTQLFPGRPTYTEADIPSLEGKVFIVTGGNSGVGYELVKILYAKGGKVYVAGRSQARVEEAIGTIKATVQTTTPGHLEMLIVDVSDLRTIKAGASSFLERETRLDVLFNNAGVSLQPPGSVTAQGLESHMGTNCVGPHLLTKLLLPTIEKTAVSVPRGSVRIVWATSGIVDTAGPKGGLSIAEQAPGKHPTDLNYRYSASKAGNWFLASEVDRRVRHLGIVSIAESPGNLRTKGWDNAPKLMKAIMSLFMYDAKLGASTMLWSGFNPEVTPNDGGRFVIPWGRWHPAPRKDCLESMKSKEEGGTGLAADFWHWCEEQTKAYA